MKFVDCGGKKGTSLEDISPFKVCPIHDVSSYPLENSWHTVLIILNVTF